LHSTHKNDIVNYLFEIIKPSAYSYTDGFIILPDFTAWNYHGVEIPASGFFVFRGSASGLYKPNKTIKTTDTNSHTSFIGSRTKVMATPKQHNNTFTIYKKLLTFTLAASCYTCRLSDKIRCLLLYADNMSAQAVFLLIVFSVVSHRKG